MDLFEYLDKFANELIVPIFMVNAADTLYLHAFDFICKC